MFGPVILSLALVTSSTVAAPRSHTTARTTAHSTSPAPVVAASDDDMPAGDLAGGLPAAAAAARARYLEGEFSLAVAAADAVDAAFVAGPAFTNDAAAFNAWADAQATKAMAMTRMGENADAVWQAIAVVRPTWTPDKNFMPPKHVTRYQSLRDKLLAGATIAVVVEHNGKSPVYFDGRAVSAGNTLDVMPGRHFVGRESGGKVVVVDAPLTIQLDPKAAAVEPPPAIVEEDGPPWVLIGVGAGIVVAAGVVVTVVLLMQDRDVPTNPGGTTVAVDASGLNRLVVTP